MVLLVGILGVLYAGEAGAVSCPPCSGDRPICNGATGSCVACLVDSSCPPTQYCSQAGTCTPTPACTRNQDCPTELTCCPGMHTCIRAGVSETCHLDSECGAGQRCDPSRGTCYKPAQAATCAKDDDCSPGSGCNLVDGCFSECPDTPSYCDTAAGHCVSGTAPAGGCAVSARTDHSPLFALAAFAAFAAFAFSRRRRLA